jgi:ribosomal protein L16 Arg81 hydroxylase
MPLLLEELLGELPLSTFFNEHYLKLPLARRAVATRLRERATWELIDRLVETPACDLVLVRDGVAWSGPRPSTAAEARALYAQGYSLVLRHPDRYDAGLAELGRTLSAELQGTINLHVYCTPARHGSFGWHCDPEEVFIFQTAGVKRYQMRQNTLNPAPLLETLATGADASRETTPLLECQLEAGDWLYIPGGFWHEVTAPEDSISISVGVMPATPMHVLDFVRSQLLRSERWRQRFPPLGHASQLSDAEKLDYCRTLFRELGTELKGMFDDPRFMLRFLAAWASAGLRSSSLAEAAPAPRAPKEPPQ